MMMTVLERALRRKHILDDYGITIENTDFNRWLTIISSDQELEDWFGERLQKYILEAFDEVERLALRY
jgi:hypothetical protein